MARDTVDTLTKSSNWPIRGDAADGLWLSEPANRRLQFRAGQGRSHFFPARNGRQTPQAMLAGCNTAPSTPQAPETACALAVSHYYRPLNCPSCLRRCNRQDVPRVCVSCRRACQARPQASAGTACRSLTCSPDFDVPPPNVALSITILPHAPFSHPARLCRRQRRLHSFASVRSRPSNPLFPRPARGRREKGRPAGPMRRHGWV